MTIDQTPEEPKKVGRPPKKDTVTVIVMAPNGVWLGNPPKRRAFRERVEMAPDEAKAIPAGLVEVI